MSVTTTLHINFRGDAKPALEFYHSVFGGDLTLVPYGDAPAGQGPDQGDQIIWGQVLSPNGFHIMAFDVRDSQSWSRGEIPFFVSLRGTDADETTGFWNALAESEGATIVEPFGPSAFSPLYGMVTDRFGVTWVVDVAVAWA
jgi:PhnB protein